MGARELLQRGAAIKPGHAAEAVEIDGQGAIMRDE